MSDFPPKRKRPAQGVHVSLSEPTIVFVTVNAKDKKRCLATPAAHELLAHVWNEASAWTVGRYMIMPDHVHFFCSPHDFDFSLERWMRYWKSLFSRRRAQGEGTWQRAYWDTRLRRGEIYTEKWEYVRMNPVRAGLCENSDEWPFQGELNELRWF